MLPSIPDAAHVVYILCAGFAQGKSVILPLDMHSLATYPERRHMSQSRPRRRPPNMRPEPRGNGSRAPLVYVAIVAIVVFSLILAGLSSVDWSGALGGDNDPTPDYAVDTIAMQQTVVAQNPDDLAAQGLLASMLANSGRMQEAIPIYERILERDPDNVEVRLSFAQSLQSNGMRQDAEPQFLKVIELDPNNHTAHYFLARLYMDWQPRREEEAIIHFRKVVEIAPDSFYAEQAQSVLDTVGQSTPIASPAASD